MTKRILYITLGFAILLSGCQKQQHDEHDKHKTHTAGQDSTVRLSAFIESTNKKVISTQTTVKPVLQVQSSLINAYGIVTLDERRSNQVAARVGGRIEKLYVKYENQYVRKGDKILDLYSVDLNTYQEELLFAQRVDPDGELPKHAAHKLRLLGVTDKQVNSILESGKTFFTLSVYSPYDGYIFYSPSPQMLPSKNAMAASGSNRMSGGMNAGTQEKSMTSSPMSTASGPIREGAYVSAGQTLFWINDLREVWGILSVDNLHQEEIALNDSVTVISELMPEKPVRTRIRFIEPQYTSGQKFIQIRVYLPNRNNELRINSLLDATIYSKPGEMLSLPASSILYLGGRQAVWKKTGETTGGSHVFEIQFVSLGPVSQGRVAVLKGLSINDEVALDAGYLMDRESLVKPE